MDSFLETMGVITVVAFLWFMLDPEGVAHNIQAVYEVFND